MKSKTKVMLLSVLMAAVFGVCNLGGVARLSFVSKAATEPQPVTGLIYDGTGHSLLDSNVVPDDTTKSFAYSIGGGTFSFDIPEKKDAGTYDIQYAVVDSSTTDFSTVTAAGTVKASISKAQLTITADNQSVKKGGTIDSSLVSVGALKTGDTYDLNSVTLSADTSALTTSGEIKPSGGTVNSGTPIGNNYEVTYVNGTLTVTAPTVTSVTVTPATVTVSVGGSTSLSKSVVVDPDVDINKEVTWSSSDDSTASVDSTGKVTVHKEGGPVTITATSKDDKSKQGNATITITPATGTVTGVSITDEANNAVSAFALKTPQYRQLKAVVAPSTASQNVTWTSSNSAVAEVDSTGKVTAKSVGSAVITATSVADNTKKAEATVTVADKYVLYLHKQLLSDSTKFDTQAVSKQSDVNIGSNLTEANVTSLFGDELKGLKLYSIGNNTSPTWPYKGDNAAVHLYYTRLTYTLSFDLNGGKTSDGKTTLAEKKLMYEAQVGTYNTDGKLPVPVKEGFVFAGWYNAPSEGTLFKDDTPMPAQDMTLHARWDAGDISGTQELVGDAVSGNPVTGVQGSSINEYAIANSAALRKEANLVTGDSLQLDLQVKRLPATDSAIANYKTDYDRWTRAAFFGFADGDITISYLDISVPVMVKKASASSFTANGQKVSDTITPIEIGLKMDSNVLAKRPVIMRVHSGEVKNFVSIGSRPTASKDYVDGTYYIDTTNGVLYLYSRYFSVYTIAYAENAHLVTFNLDGGSGVPEQLLVKHGATLADLTEPTKNGYNFDGWFTDAAKNNLWNDTDAVNGDMALFASWTTGQSSNRAPRSNTNTDGATETDERSVRGSRTGDNKEAERIARLLAIMTTTWIVLFNALAFGKKRRQRVRRR